MRLVIRLGGSVVATPVNTRLIAEYTEVFKKLKVAGHEFVVVVGGGELARNFIQYGKDLGLDERDQDDLAILVSRIFAQLFAKALRPLSCEVTPLSIESAVECLEKGKIVVMGGLRPGMTTDTVAALVAERLKAEILVKATDQEGIYDKDPRKHADAVKLEKLSFEDLSKVLEEKVHRAGIHQILDPEAVKVLKASHVKVVVLNGFKPENIFLAVEGKNVGTIIE